MIENFLSGINCIIDNKIIKSTSISPYITFLDKEAERICLEIMTSFKELQYFAGLTNIYVPAGSVNAYKTAPYWSDYANIISATIV